MKKISAVIFDCDGVMFDSRQANINFYNHILDHFGLPPMSREEVDYVHSHTAIESVDHVFRGTSWTEEAHAFRLQMDYSPFVRDMIIEPGLKDLLNAIKPRFGLAVATSRSTTIGDVLKWNGLDHYFDIVVSSLDVENPKPHPESVFKILTFFGLRPDQAVYIGDSAVDYKTATAAGVHFVSFGNKDLDTPFKTRSMTEMVAILAAIENHTHHSPQRRRDR